LRERIPARVENGERKGGGAGKSVEKEGKPKLKEVRGGGLRYHKRFERGKRGKTNSKVECEENGNVCKGSRNDYKKTRPQEERGTTKQKGEEEKEDRGENIDRLRH